MAPRTRSQKRVSSFLDLPPEIRNVIYELLLIGTRNGDFFDPRFEIIRPEIEIMYLYDKTGVRNWGHNQDPLWPNLLATCRTIHDEASSILYGANHFTITMPNRRRSERAKALHQPFWTTSIGRSVERIRKVRVTLSRRKDCRFLLHSLKPIRSLESLHVEAAAFRPYTYNICAKEMAQVLYPLVSHLNKCRKNMGTSGLDILEIACFAPEGVKKILAKWLEEFRPSSARIRAQCKVDYAEAFVD